VATRYVRSTDGNNADSGATWALAKLDLVGVAAIDTAGDTIWVSQNHNETTAAAITIAIANTVAAPGKILCGNDGAAPPTALATTAVVSTTGASAINIGNGIAQFTYVYGITFKSGSAANAANIAIGHPGEYESCVFWLNNTSTSSRVTFGGTSNIVLTNCGFKFGAAGQSLTSTANGEITINGGSILSGGTSPTAFIGSANNQNIRINGFDFSNASSSMNVVGSGGDVQKITLRDCKMPASWSGVLNSSAPGVSSICEMFNCDSGDTNYRYRKATQFGTIQDETTLVRTGGASDGSTTYSLKMVTNANGEYPVSTLGSPEIVKWNSTTGSAITATIEILFDSATALKDDEVWLEVMYLGASGVPLASFISDAKANVLATAADQTSSSVTWTTTGMANPNKRSLGVTFTPQEAGFIHAVVKLAKASTTVYVDPLITVT